MSGNTAASTTSCGSTGAPKGLKECSNLAAIKAFTGTQNDAFWNYSCVLPAVNVGEIESQGVHNVPPSAMAAGTTQLFNKNRLISSYTPTGDNPGQHNVFLGNQTYNIRFTLQGDGNFVGYNGATPIWTLCRTPDNVSPNGAALYITDDGNFIIKDIKTAKVLFARGCTIDASGSLPSSDPTACVNSHPGGKETGTKAGDRAKQGCGAGGDYKIAIQQDGKLIMYNGSTPVWSNVGDGFSPS
jgi:hypothetical protein